MEQKANDLRSLNLRCTREDVLAFLTFRGHKKMGARNGVEINHESLRDFCTGRKMNLFEFMSVLFSVDSTIKWLKECNLLRKEYCCPDCKKLCSWTKDSSKSTSTSGDAHNVGRNSPFAAEVSSREVIFH